MFPRMGVLAAAGLAILFSAGNAIALPGYARDSTVSCFSCHYKSASEYIGGAIISGEESNAVELPTKGKMRAGIQLLPDSVKGSEAAHMVHSGPGLSPAGKYGVNTKPLAGVSGYVGAGIFQASAGWLNPEAGVVFLEGEKPSGSEFWYRMALTPKAGGMDFTLGVFGSRLMDLHASSSLRLDAGEDAADMPIHASRLYSSVGFDAGVRGDIAGYSLDLKTVYMENSDDSQGAGRILGTSGPRSFMARARVGLNKDFGFSAAYSTFNSTDGLPSASGLADKSATFGAWLTIKDSFRIMPEYTVYGLMGEKLSNGPGEFNLKFFTGF